MKALLLIQIGRDHFHQSLLSTGGFNSSLPSEYLLKSQLPSRTALGLVCLKGTLLLRQSWLGCLVHPGAGLTAFTTAQISPNLFPTKKRCESRERCKFCTNMSSPACMLFCPCGLLQGVKGNDSTRTLLAEVSKGRLVNRNQ